MIFYNDGREEDFASIKKIKLHNYYRDDPANINNALNYMDEQGYELISSTSSSLGIHHFEKYIFRREIKK